MEARTTEQKVWRGCGGCESSRFFTFRRESLQELRIVLLDGRQLLLDLLVEGDLGISRRQVGTSTAPIVVENAAKISEPLHQAHRVSEGIFRTSGEIDVDHLVLDRDGSLFELLLLLQ